MQVTTARRFLGFAGIRERTILCAMKYSTVLVLAISAGLCFGCGGDDGGGDEEAIREVVRLSLTTTDPEADCNERLSDSLIERTYGTRRRCERIQREDEEEDDEADAKRVDFVSVRIEGDSASARIQARGGEIGSVGGTLEVAREDGQWRIDGIAIPLLRTLMEAGLRSAEDLSRGAVGCVERQLAVQPDPQFRRFAYRVIGQRRDAQVQIFELLAECEGEGGVSVLRQIFENGIVESLRERNADRAVIDCVLSGLRDRLEDDELIEIVSGPEPGEAAGRILAPLIASCGSEPEPLS
jgi:hypothetical protein